MLKELFETAKTVDAAIDLACEKLGCSCENCEWEIISLPKRGFLGLKNTPAKVRVSIEVPDEKPSPQNVQPGIETKVIQKSEHKPVEPQKSVQNIKVERPYKAPQKAEPVKAGEISEKEKIATDYLASIINEFGLKADYVVTHEHGGSCINIVGDGLGMIIGRRGETLDAIQYLAGLVANRGEGDYLRLTVDCGRYRSKRKDTLEALAKKLASQVLKTNISKTLEPMNPFERRIIHATVSEIEGIISSSVGEEPNRRVVITSPTAKSDNREGFTGRREHERGGYNRGREQRWDKRRAADSKRTSDNIDNTGSGDINQRSSHSEERPSRVSRDNADRERSGFNNSSHGREDRGRRPRSGGERRGGRPQQQAAPQGPPKQTPEASVTSGISFGKIDLE